MITVSGTVASFLLAVLVYWLFALVIDAFVKDGRANEIFKIILLIFCVLLALGGTIFIHA